MMTIFLDYADAYYKAQASYNNVTHRIIRPLNSVFVYMLSVTTFLRILCDVQERAG